MNNCKDCRWQYSEDRMKPCPICSNYDMYEDIPVYQQITNTVGGEDAFRELCGLNEKKK